jgi:beta-N-acetylhexosaminidase
VQRMAPPHWPKYPPARAFAAINDPWTRRETIRLGARLIAHDLRAAGITMDCAPVVDTPIVGAHDVIGDRAYALDPVEVARSARAAMEGFLAGSVLPVMKHIPGHGRAFVDSHLALPVVDAPLEALVLHDFAPFRQITDCPAAMTAHLVYTAIDRRNPATLSRKVVRGVIRGTIGFDGLLMSDDLSMKALSGSFAEKARRVLAAGCDLVLHCSGIIGEMREVAAHCRELKGAAARRATAALARIAHVPEPFDAVDGRKRFESALAGLAAT